MRLFARWVAHLVVPVCLAALCAACDSEAKNGVRHRGSAPGRVDKPAPGSKEPGKRVVFAEPFERIRIEAEAATKIVSDDALHGGKVMRIEEAAGASGGRCIYIPDKAGTPEKEGRFARAVYTFTVRKTGLYTFWCRRKWYDPPQCGDTFAVRFDREGQPRNLDKTEYLFGADDTSRPPRWGWSPVHVKGKPRQFFLKAGQHTMEILNREDGPRFDVILLTDDPDYVPQGMEE